MRKLSLTVAAALLLSVGAAQAQAFKLFQSPSHNIGCVLSKQGARCDIAVHDWVSPPKPAWCDVDYGGGLQIGKHGRGSFVCAGDTTLHQGGVLPYGSSYRRGRFKCKSLTTGMKCTNRRNGHGFKLSREHARRF